jgi:hypothetical protein
MAVLPRLLVVVVLLLELARVRVPVVTHLLTSS